MKRVFAGIGGLVEQPLYLYGAARHGTSLHRWSYAHYYRLIIFALASTMIGLTAYKAFGQSPRVAYLLVLGLIGYMALFIARLTLRGERERLFYDSRIQFGRAVASTLAVTILIGVLAAAGIFDHNLWLLYVLGTILVSQHNGTRLLLLILVWVSFSYFAASYLGSAINSGGWESLNEFAVGKAYLAVTLVGIYLVSFLFHYLMHNILARDMAHEGYRRWMELVSDQWASTLEPNLDGIDLDRQLQEWVRFAEQLTGATGRLWLPRLNDGALLDQTGEQADGMICAVVAEREPLLAKRDFTLSLPRRAQSRLAALLRQRAWGRRDWPGEARVKLYSGYTLPDGTQARLVIPLYRVKKPDRLVGILDLTYLGDQPDIPAINRHLDQVFDFGDRARLMLAACLQREYVQREHRLIDRLSRLPDPIDIAQQIAADMVEAYGFDFATVSFVDPDQEVIRPVAGVNAPWVNHAPHALDGNDVQSRVVREGQVYVNNGQLDPWLDKQIFHEFAHHALSRAWAPVPPGVIEPDASFKAVATIEAGFHHTHQAEVPADLIHWLTSYARQATTPLTNAITRARERELLDRLERLSDFSQLMQQTTTMLETNQVIQQVLAWGQVLLGANCVLLLIPDDAPNRFQTAYQPADAFYARKRVRLPANYPIFDLMQQSDGGYTSPDARHDPYLEPFNVSRQRGFQHHLLRSRRNYKSFAGIKLVNKKQQLLGYLCMFYQSRQAFHDEDRHILGLFARHAAVALEETRANRLLRDIAVMQERNYLESELHHWLSQQLFAIRLGVEAAALQIERGDEAALAEAIGSLMEDTEHGSLALEAMLNQLHENPPPTETDFIAEFSDYISRLQARFHTTTLIFETSGDTQAAPRQVQFYLLRIAREALNNALKHASPQYVRVDYDVNDDGIRLAVEDDGIGFALDRGLASDRFGLRSMEYYADRLNATLDVQSSQGKGTKIEVFVKTYGLTPRGTYAKATN